MKNKINTKEAITVGEIKKLREAGFPITRIAYFMRLDLDTVNNYVKAIDSNK